MVRAAVSRRIVLSETGYAPRMGSHSLRLTLWGSLSLVETVCRSVVSPDAQSYRPPSFGPRDGNLTS